VITFVLDAASVPDGETYETLALLRDGDPVPACTGDPLGDADPDPCISARTPLGNGDVSITALSSHASVWNLAAEDDIAPETTIAAGPKSETADRTPKFRFTASEALATFECRIDDSDWKACLSPYKSKRLSFGKHKFEVAATDQAQNEDLTPAKRRFKVVR
jgi:hypothetical protein